MNSTKVKINHHNRTVNGTFYSPDNLERFPMVIMSHGFNGSEEDFVLSASYLTNHGIGCVCYDFCGGSLQDTSGYPTTEMTLFTEKEDLCAVLEEVRSWECTERKYVYLFGASQGGMVSALAAEECTDKIDGLILLYPALCIMDNWNERFPKMEDIPDVEELWGMKLGRKFFESIHGLDVKQMIGHFYKHVLIMHGQNDEVVPVGYSEWAHRQYQHAKLKVFGKEGHGFSYEGDRDMEIMVADFILEQITS